MTDIRGSKKILVVEDDKEIARLLELRLKSEGLMSLGLTGVETH